MRTRVKGRAGRCAGRNILYLRPQHLPASAAPRRALFPSHPQCGRSVSAGCHELHYDCVLAIIRFHASGSRRLSLPLSHTDTYLGGLTKTHVTHL